MPVGERNFDHFVQPPAYLLLILFTFGLKALNKKYVVWDKLDITIT